MLPESFHPAVAGWFRSAFPAPTGVQLKAWDAIGSGTHTLISAPTGSGKTLAAFLGVIDLLAKQAGEGTLRDETQILYVSPLKALSNDIEKNLRAPLEGIGREFAAQMLGEAPIRAAVRTAARIGASPSICAANSRPMPSSGARRFFSMSFDSAFSGETYRICVSSRSVPSPACFASRSMTPRNAASVLPEPVGALISVCVPEPIASHALSCTPVGAGKALRNQPATAGWKDSGSMGLGC